MVSICDVYDDVYSIRGFRRTTRYEVSSCVLERNVDNGPSCHITLQHAPNPTKSSFLTNNAQSLLQAPL